MNTVITSYQEHYFNLLQLLGIYQLHEIDPLTCQNIMFILPLFNRICLFVVVFVLCSCIFFAFLFWVPFTVAIG